MKIPYNDLAQQHAPIRGDLDAAIKEVIETTQFIGKDGNPYVQRFEKSFATFAGTEHCIGCANGTEAIELALRALGIGPGDEVIVPAQTWISTAEAVSHVGGTPVFCDICSDTYTIDPQLFSSLKTERTKAIIPVHLYGLPADMDPILAFAREHDLFVIEDCAQAHGALYQGRPVGTMGDAGTFSFYPGKNLGAMGDAGGIVTNSDDTAEIIRSLRDHGRAPGFDHSREGRNSRLDGIQAAVLDIKLAYLRKWTEQRQALGALYRERLGAIGVGFQATPKNLSHVYHVFSIQIEKRDDARRFLTDRSIQTGVHYPIALPFTTAYRNLGYNKDNYPEAESQMSKALSIPLFPDMTEEQLDYIVDSIRQFQEQ